MSTVYVPLFRFLLVRPLASFELNKLPVLGKDNMASTMRVGARPISLCCIAAILLGLVSRSEQYVTIRGLRLRVGILRYRGSSQCHPISLFASDERVSKEARRSETTRGTLHRLCGSTSDYPSMPSAEQSKASFPSSREELNTRIEQLCQENADDAIHLLEESEDMMSNHNDLSIGAYPDHYTYTILLQSLATGGSNKRIDDDHVEYRLHASHTVTQSTLKQIENIFGRMKELGQKHEHCKPTNLAYSAVILAWSKSYRREAGQRCEQLLNELWAKHNATIAATETNVANQSDKDEGHNSFESRYIPLKSTYISTLTAIARSAGGLGAAERAEALLEEMELLGIDYPHLEPTTVCVNIVL
jgi:hypothetical protein